MDLSDLRFISTPLSCWRQVTVVLKSPVCGAPGSRSSAFLLPNEDKDDSQKLREKLNNEVKVRRRHGISTPPDVPQSPDRASTKWRWLKSAQGRCPHRLALRDRRNPSDAAATTTPKEVRASVAQMDQPVQTTIVGLVLRQEKLSGRGREFEKFLLKISSKRKTPGSPGRRFGLMRQKCLAVRLDDVWRQQMHHFSAEIKLHRNV